MNSRAYTRIRHIHKRDSLSPDLIKSISTVLDVAAGDLRSNIFLFPDVLSEVNFAPEQKIYAMTIRPSSPLFHDPCFALVKDAVMRALSRGPFPVVMWISFLALSSTVPEVFRTGVLAHELHHARQIDHAEEIGEGHDILDAWDCYEDFLTEKQQPLSYWERPLEIDAELSAREVIQKLHPGESLHPLLRFYKDYEPVLEFESSGEFDLLKYFATVIRQGPSGLRDWVLTADRMCRENVILSQLAQVAA